MEYALGAAGRFAAPAAGDSGVQFGWNQAEGQIAWVV